MSLLDSVRSAVAPQITPAPRKLPPEIQSRMQRGRKVMLKDAPKRRLCLRFRRGDSYFYLNTKNWLLSANTAPGVGGKPSHRIRNKYDFIGPIVDAKVSQATRRVPSYEASPATTDPQDVGGARLAEKVARFGYDQWRVRKAKTKVIDLAITAGEGFALPYFDPNIGPFTPVDGQMVGRGEIKILTLSGNEVYWEPGVDFDDSRWYAIERARPLDDIRGIPGYIKGSKIAADASTSDIPTDRDFDENMAIVTEYFERPSPDFPDGRCIVSCQGQPIVDYRLDPNCPDDWTDWFGPYPLRDVDDTILDEPLLHRLVYRVDPDLDRDLGPVWLWIDFQRTIQDCWNKILEWKNRCLNPQMVAELNSLIDGPDDVPGSVRYYRPGTQNVPQWEKVPSDWVNPLFQVLRQAVQDLFTVAGYEDATADPRVSGEAISAADSQSQSRWESFLAQAEEWESRMMRHCLLLVARHYSEPRLLAIRGRWGQPQRIQDFLGSHLFGQVDIRVIPNSTAPRSRQQVQQELAWIQANFPGYLTPEVAIAALRNGTADDLIQGYELDMARVNGIIQGIVDGSIFEMPDRNEWVPDRVDPMTGAVIQPAHMEQVPSYQPSEVDSLPIWTRMFGDWMKTDEFLRLDPAMAEVANNIWAAIKYREAQQAQQALIAQNAQAQSLGLDNAAKPQVKGMPSQPGDGQSPPAQP